jgi:hypothetical protein
MELVRRMKNENVLRRAAKIQHPPNHEMYGMMSKLMAKGRKVQD